MRSAQRVPTPTRRPSAASGAKDNNAKTRADESVRLLAASPKVVDVTRFRSLVKQSHPVLRSTVQTHLALKPEADLFKVNESLDTLNRELAATGNDEALLAAHQAALQRLDAYLTFTQK